MKRLIYYFFFVIALLVSSNLQAQDAFLGLAMGGKLEEATKFYTTKGFTELPAEDQVDSKKALSLGGKSDDVFYKIHLFFTPKSKKIYKIRIDFNRTLSWDTLLTEYNNAVQGFTRKYQEPEVRNDNFSSPYKKDQGTDQIKGLSEGKVVMTSKWKLKGENEISVSAKGFALRTTDGQTIYEGEVFLEYHNAAAKKIDEKERQENFNSKF